jgi:hypothetical protein
MDLAGGQPSPRRSKPSAVTLVGRLVFGKSRMMTAAVRLSAGWLAARVLLTPHVDQMQQTSIAL